MKKDRLDDILRDALSTEGDTRDVGQEGLHRFKKRLITGGDTPTVFDTMLKAALVGSEATAPDTVTDNAMRRLRSKLQVQRSGRWAPAFKPALVFAPLAAIAIILIILQILPSIRPGTITGDADTGVFAQVAKVRADILARLPAGFEDRSSDAIPQLVHEYDLPLESRRISKLDTFSTKARGESFARRIGGNRRTILASLADNGDKMARHHPNGIAPGDVSPAPTRHEIMLNQKLDKVGFGF